MKPYTAHELDALQVLAELHADTCSPARDTRLANEVLTLILMLRERDEVIAKLHVVLDEYESRIREAVLEFNATVRVK